MKVFVIPTWYPCESGPIAGSFIQEHVRYFGECFPNDRIIVSVAGTGGFFASLRKPVSWLAVALRYAKSPKFREESVRNVTEYHRPVVTWTDKLGGNLSGIVAAHEKNFFRALKVLGKIDVIHAHVSYPGGYAAMVLARRSGIPFIITEHMGPFPFRIRRFVHAGVLTKWIRDPIQSADAVIAVSSALAREFKEFGLRKPVVVPNIVDERKYKPCPRVSGKRRFRFLTVGVREQKGIPDLLRAIALLTRCEKDVHFKIVGDGPKLDAYKRLATKLGIQEVIEWVGVVPRTAMPSLFQDCDAFVLASRHESFGIVYAEAIACGKPVLATKCGGAEDIVTSKNGLLVDVGDISGINKAMLRIIRDYDRYEPLQIRKDFLSRFARPTVAGEIRDVYASVIQGVADRAQ